MFSTDVLTSIWEIVKRRRPSSKGTRDNIGFMEYLFLGWKGVIFVTLFVAIDEFSLERADSVSHPDWDLFYVDSWKFYVDKW